MASSKQIFLIRHAEPLRPAAGQAADPDPPLADAGVARAGVLAGMLGKADIVSIYVSQRRRTQQTAAPLAAKLGLKPIIESQDRASLEKISKALQSIAAGKCALVVGHTDTLPDLIRLLGASPPTIQSNEFSRMFVVTLADKKVTMESRTYGDPTP